MTVLLTGAFWRAVAGLVLSGPCEAGPPPDGNVDRVEAGFAVILTDAGPVVHREACGLAEGDVIRDGRPDAAAREGLRERVLERRGRLSEGEDGGELTL